MTNELIPYWDPADTITCHAEAAVTGKRFVTISGPRVADLPQVSTAGAGARVFGVSSRDTAITDAFTVHRAGVLPVLAGAAITAGELLASDALGRAVPANGGVAVAVAVDDAVDATDVPVVLISGGDGGAGVTPGDAVPDLVDNTGGVANGTLVAIPDLADAPATADALRDDFVTNVAPVIESNFADLADKVNDLLAELRQAGVIAT